MQYAYVQVGEGSDSKPELCLVPERPDRFSRVLPVSSLFETKAAILLVGPYEGATVRIDPEDGGLVIKPLSAVKLFITPNLSDRPGNHVRELKVVRQSDGEMISFFKEDRDRDSDPWRSWEPLTRQL